MREKPVKPSMQSPAIYRIVVGRQIDSRHSARLEAMNITEEVACDGGVEAILVGRLADQAALSGVLNTLYSMHCPVLSVECLDSG